MESDVSTTVTLTPMMAYVGAWLSTCGLFWVLFSRGETILSHDVKIRVRNTLKGESNLTGRVDTWPQQFVGLFDSVFGEKHLSWKCFFHSCLASMVAVLITTLIWRAIDFNIFFGSWDLSTPLVNVEIDTPNESVETIISPLFLFILGVPLNLIPDYVSLLETRYILGLKSFSKSLFSILGFLLVNLLATVAIFISWFALVIKTNVLPIVTIHPMHDDLLKYLAPSEDFTAGVGNLFSAIVFLLSENYFHGFMFILFCSTFFTSVWVWLYALSYPAVRPPARAADRTWRALTYLVDIDNKPILSLGTISIVLITLGYLVAAPFVLYQP